MNKFFTTLLGVLGLISTSCAQADGIRSVNADEFEKGIKNQQTQVVDVRTADEYAAGYIANAQNIDVTESNFLQKATKALDKKKVIYVYCRSGKRSMVAAQKLTDAGYKVVNLEGGIMGWIAAGKPITQYKSAATPSGKK